jgi:hypothetical protein
VERGYDKQAPGMVGNLFHLLYDAGPETAVTLALQHSLKLENLRWNSNGLKNVLKMWSVEDPEAAFGWVEGMESPASKDLALNVLSSAWAEHDLLGSLENLWHRLDGKQKDQLVDEFRNVGLKGTDPESLLAWVDENVDSPAMRGKILTCVVGGVRNSREPELIAALVPHVDSSDRKVITGVREAAKKWASTDRDALQAWIDTVENPKIRGAALAGLANGLIEADPMSALELFTAEGSELSESEGLSRHSVGRLLEAVGNAGMNPEDVLGRLLENLRGEAMMSYAEKFAKESASSLSDLSAARSGSCLATEAYFFRPGHRRSSSGPAVGRCCL